ncbi:autorepressor SdpR family transcription factor [Caproicibacter sp.]|uniref:autorepressor SdpR family transcription factor n=1 Tax=Caproicibacter sp. TaxID=2814884 RepID=UPI003989C801
MALANTFKALSDPTRREILNLLRARPLSAGEIGAHFSMTGATVSHHLAILKDAGLVFDRHEGKYIFYELNLSVFEEVLNWFQTFLDQKGDSHEEAEKK